MEEDAQRLLISLEGRFTKYERDFQRAIRSTEQNFRTMERRAQQSADKMESSMVKAARGMGNALKTFGAGLLGGVAGGLAVGSLDQIIGRIGKVAEGVANVGSEARRAGVSLQAFQELKFVAEQNRIGVDSLVDGLKELNLRADEWILTGKGPAAEAFTRLRFTAEQLASKLHDPAQLLVEIIGRLGELDKAAQIRVADEIFGGSAGERFVELIDQGAAGIRATIDEANRLGIVMDEELITRADEIDRRFKAISTTVSTNLKRSVVEIVTLMGDFLDSFRDVENQVDRNLEGRIKEIFGDVAAARQELADLQAMDSVMPTPFNERSIREVEARIKALTDEAGRLREILYGRAGGPDQSQIHRAGEEAEEAKPKVDSLGSALDGVNGAAGSGATGINSFADAVRALKGEIPELAAQLAELDAQSRIDGIYRAAVSKARTMSEIEAANALHSQASAALRTKDVRAAADKGMLDLIGHAEGTDAGRSYNETLGYGRFTGGPRNLVLMTLDDIDRMQTGMLQHPDNDFNSSAAGRYQIVQKTLRGLRDELGLSGDELFSPELQDRMAQQLIRRRGNSISGLRAEWQGLNNVDAETIRAAFDNQSLSMPAIDPGVADRQQIAVDTMREQFTAYSQVIHSAKQYTAAQSVERQALEMTRQQAAALRHEQELLNRATQDGIMLSPRQRDELRTLAQGMAEAEAATYRAAASQEQLQAMQGYLGAQIGGFFTSIVTGSATAEQALQRLLGSLADAAFQAAFLGAGPLAGLFGGGGGLFGALFGGLTGVPVAAASGGLIRGPGTGTSDSIPARLSDGEYVINAKQTAKHRAMLDAINSGTAIAGYAAGGYVGNKGSFGPPASNASSPVTIKSEVTVNTNGGGTPEQNDDLARKVSKHVEIQTRAIVQQELRNAGRPGGVIYGR